MNAPVKRPWMVHQRTAPPGAGSTQVGFPNAPVLDASGGVVPVWRAFFYALWARTGSAPGGSFAEIEAELAKEEAARAAADSALSLAISNEGNARIAADNAEAAARARADAVLQAEINALPAQGPMLARWWYGPGHG